MRRRVFSSSRFSATDLTLTAGGVGAIGGAAGFGASELLDSVLAELLDSVLAELLDSVLAELLDSVLAELLDLVLADPLELQERQH